VQVVPLVNNQYPGPTIEGTVGDRVRVTVVNKLPSESTSMHWHGVKQIGTPWSDGVPLVTQCPILPGQSFVYDFVLDSPGTLWWHSHTDLQKSSLYGAIVIHGDERPVGNVPLQDKVLLLNDWYHSSSASEIEGLNQRLPNPFVWIGDPQSLLINGRGTFNCSATTLPCNPNSPDAGPFILDVEPGRTYRLRIVGAASLSYLNLNIDMHSMEIVEADASLVEPFTTQYVDLGQGQTISAILRTYTVEELQKKAPGHSGNFWIQTNVRHRATGPSGLAVLRYSSANKTLPVAKPSTEWPAWNDTAWSLKQARQYKSRHPVAVPSADRRFVYLGTQNRLTDGRLAWALNNISYEPGNTPIIQALVLDTVSEESKWVEQTTIPTPFDYTKTLAENNLSIIARRETQVVKVRKDEVIEFVFQNTLALAGAAETHPWHLHLHSMWVLGYGEARTSWKPSDVSSYNTRNPPLRNTFMLYPQSWTAIRFKADNPGAANFHCHILAHLHMGMGFVLQIGNASQIPCAPVGTPFCGVGGDTPEARRRGKCLARSYGDSNGRGSVASES
jgi:L-ascorbate oxidase